MALYHWNKKALNRKSAAHHGSETGNPSPKSRRSFRPTWPTPHHPHQKDQIACNAYNSIAHHMGSELKKFKQKTPNNQDSSINENVNIAELIGRSEPLPLDYNQGKIEHEKKRNADPDTEIIE